MKRRNKSRLTHTDVNSICKMQHKIDRLHQFILSIYSIAIDGKYHNMIQEDDMYDDPYIFMAMRVIKEIGSKNKVDEEDNNK